MDDKKESVWDWLWKPILVAVPTAIIGGMVFMFLTFVNHTMGTLRDIRTDTDHAIATQKQEMTKLIQDQVSLVIKEELASIREKVTIFEEKQSSSREEIAGIKSQLTDFKEITTLKERLSNLEKQITGQDASCQNLQKEIQEIRDRVLKMESKLDSQAEVKAAAKEAAKEAVKEEVVKEEKSKEGVK